MSGSAGAPPLGRPHALLDRLRLGPVAGASLVAAGAFGLCVLGNNLDGAWQGLRVHGQPFYAEPFGRMALAVSMLLGFLCVWPRQAVAGALADFEAIRPRLACPADEAEALRDRLACSDPRTLRRSRWTGVFVAPIAPIIMASTSEPGFAIFFPAYVSFNTAWSLVATGLLFYWIGRAAHLCAHWVRVLGTLAARLGEPDPLDPEPVMAFGRSATRLALGWIGTGSISAFMLANPTFVAPLIPLVGLAVASGLLCFFQVVLPVRRRIRETRARELARARRAAREERGALYQGEGGGRLAALLAWEAQLREWSPWPFETPVGLRGALLVLLPLGSWVGGALVERLLEWALATG